MKTIKIFSAILFSTLLNFAALASPNSANGNLPVTKVTIQASGLTCSMCSNAINKALKSVSYVDKVYANIKSSSFDLSFKPGADVNFDELKKKVEDAGFFVAKFHATLQLGDLELNKDEHVNIGGALFHFLNTGSKKVSGEQTIQVLDKGFVTAKEYKKNGSLTRMACYKTGKAGSCCTKHGASSGARVYHVTI